VMASATITPSPRSQALDADQNGPENTPDPPSAEPPELLRRIAQPRIAIPLLGAFGALLFLLNLGGYPLYTKGEPREAVTVFDIANGAGIILPMRAGVEVPSKPLMMHWLGALISLAAGQVNEWTVRLPSAISAILGILACYYYVRKLFDERSALIAALILGTTCQYLQAGTGARVDMTLTLFLEIAFFEFIALAEGLRRPAAPLYLASACAVLTKGPIGFALPLLVAALWIILWRKAEVLPRLRPVQGAIILAIIGGGWYLAAVHQGGSAFVHKQLLVENLYRLLAHPGFQEGHAHPFYYVEGALVAGFMPWSPLAALAILQYWQRARAIGPRLGYLLVWFLTVLFFFNLPHSKRGVYLLACYPALSAMIGLLLSDAISVRSLVRWTRALSRIAGISFIAAAVCGIAGAATLYLSPTSLRWVLARFDILVAGLPPALRDTTSEHWLATISLPFAAAGIGIALLRRASLTYLVGGTASAMLAIMLAIHLVIEPAIANTLSPRDFAVRTAEFAKSQGMEYFGSLDYAFVFYSKRDVKYVSIHDTPAFVVGLEEQWHLVPAAFRANYDVVLRSDPTDLDNSGRMVLLRRVGTGSQ
jgi:4-amino-4-deoxy-L-arabinose transferase-like glycosyltransferase